jgi:hypothetical protein
MPLTWNALLLGTGPDIDTDESTLQTEFTFSGASAGSAANPLSNNIQTFTINDADNDNVWDSDNTGAPETSLLTVNGVNENVQLDSVVVYNAVITYDDGTTANITAVTIQLTDGRVYLVPEFSANADDTALNAAPIQSIALGTVVTNNTNLVANRQAGDFVPCFAKGALIRTPDGEKPVEDLVAGDLVMTADHGAQPIRWIGRRRVEADGAMAPVEISAGALGAHSAFRVSPQHKMLIGGWQAELLFGASEVLVPAKALINDETINRRIGGQVVYYHLLFASHEIIFSNGIPSESFYPADVALSGLDAASYGELIELFPEIAGQEHAIGPTARKTLRAGEARALSA